MTVEPMLRLSELERRVPELADRFSANRPFPHVVLDDLIADAELAEVERAFPDPSWPGWTSRDHVHQPWKSSCRELTAMPTPIVRLIAELSSGRFLRWLEQVSGIDHLLPDPRLDGGGLHLTEPGGWLTPHTDFHVGESHGLHRRLNLLLYLNRHWREHNGGQLELWDRARDSIVSTVPPESGTVVVFGTDANSMHGFSTPVAGRDRRSIALYYYTTAAPEGYAGDRTTYWRARGAGDATTRHRLALGAQRGLLAAGRGLSLGSRALARLGDLVVAATRPPDDPTDVDHPATPDS